MNTSVLAGIAPERVTAVFEELCRIPHGSGNTAAISRYCADFARRLGLACEQDRLNNVLIRKPASPGRETRPPVILQGHLDMVCEQAPDCRKDMAAEGLDLFPLNAVSTVSKLVIGYRRDRYLSHYAERFIAIAQEELKPKPPAGSR